MGQLSNIDSIQGLGRILAQRGIKVVVGAAGSQAKMDPSTGTVFVPSDVKVDDNMVALLDHEISHVRYSKAANDLKYLPEAERTKLRHAFRNVVEDLYVE